MRQNFCSETETEAINIKAHYPVNGISRPAGLNLLHLGPFIFLKKKKSFRLCGLYPTDIYCVGN